MQGSRGGASGLLDSPAQTLELLVSGLLGSGQPRCSRCGDVGHKPVACPHQRRLQAVSGPRLSLRPRGRRWSAALVELLFTLRGNELMNYHQGQLILGGLSCTLDFWTRTGQVRSPAHSPLRALAWSHPWTTWTQAAHVGGAPNSRVAAAPPDGWRGSAPGWSTALSQRGPGRRPPVAGSSPAALPANSCRLDFLSAGAQRRTETCCPAVVGGWTGTNLCPLPAGHLLFCCKDQGRS